MRVELIFFLSLGLAACQPTKEESPAASSSAPAIATTPAARIPEDVKYTIVSDDALPPYKRSLDVRLNKKVSEDVLTAIASELRNRDRRQFERTFIVYYLPDMQVGAGGWATTHFDPSLKVVIQGLSRDEELALVSGSTASDRHVIGQWLDDRPYVGNRITIYRSGGQLMLERRYRDGSNSEDQLRERSTSRGRRFEEIENESGEYFLIDTRGDLQAWDADGLITTARKVN